MLEVGGSEIPSTKRSNFANFSARIWPEKCRINIPVDTRHDVTSLQMSKTNSYFQITCTYNMNSPSFLIPKLLFLCFLAIFMLTCFMPELSWLCKVLLCCFIDDKVHSQPKDIFWSLQTVFFRRLLQTSPTCIHVSLTLCTHTKGIATKRNLKTLNSKNTGSKGVLGNAFCFSFFSQRWALQLCSHTSFLAGSILPVLGGWCWWDEGHPALDPRAQLSFLWDVKFSHV